jgi:hypothetical protein
MRTFKWLIIGLVGLATLGVETTAQSHSSKEDLSAIAIVNDDIASGAGRVFIHIDRWSSNAEGDRLPQTLVSNGPEAALIGKGTMSDATNVRVVKDTIELENSGTAPVMLTEITSESADK